MDNLFPQYQIQTSTDGKSWDIPFADPDLDVMRLRFEYQKTIQRVNVTVRLLGLKGENLGQAKGQKPFAPSRKSAIVEE